MHNMGLLQKLLFELADPAVTFQKVKIISCVITRLLKAHFSPLDISRYSLKIYLLQQGASASQFSHYVFSIALYLKYDLIFAQTWALPGLHTPSS